MGGRRGEDWGERGEDHINEGDTFVQCGFHFGTHARICPQKMKSWVSSHNVTI